MPGDSDSMFWGLVLKPEKRYEQVVEEPFHISKACVEPTTCKGKVVSVYVEANDEEFLVCNLSDEIMNETLDLNFNDGDKIVFKTSGTAVVHLTGYNIQEQPEGPMMFDEDDSSEEEETEEIPALTNGKKRKATSEDESTAPAKKKSNKEEKIQALEMAKKIGHFDGLKLANSIAADTIKPRKEQKEDAKKKIAEEIKKADEDDDESDDEDYEDVEDEEGSGEEEEESSDEEDEDMDSTLDTTSEGNVIRRGLSILDSTVGDSTLGDSTLDTSELDTSAMDTSAADTPAKPIKVEKKTPAKESPKKAVKPEETPAKVETPAKEVKKEVDKENETTNKQASPELSKSAKKKKNKNKELNGATGDSATPQKPEKVDTKTPKKGEEAQKTQTPAKTPAKRTLKGGIQLEDLKVGNGPEATDKKMIGMYYEGKLKSNGKVFDSTKSGKPFKFRLGAGEVIKGWDVGIAGMKVGGKRRLTIPPAMAYGKEGALPDIPANSVLIFEVECKGVN
jgi:FK506-binding nuclear protein